MKKTTPNNSFSVPKPALINNKLIKKLFKIKNFKLNGIGLILLIHFYN